MEFSQQPEEELVRQRQRDDDQKGVVKHLGEGDTPSTETASNSDPATTAALGEERPALQLHHRTRSAAGAKTNASTVSKSQHASNPTPAIARQSQYAAVHRSNGSTQGELTEGGVMGGNDAANGGAVDSSAQSEQMTQDMDHFPGTNVGKNAERQDMAPEKANPTVRQHSRGGIIKRRSSN